MAAFGLYTHIRSNRIRSIILLVGLFLLIYALTFAGALVGEALSDDAPLDIIMQRALSDMPTAIPIATIGALVWIAIAYFFHQSMINAMMGARTVSRQEEPHLYNLLENLCISRGLPMPRLAIMDTDALNAFASGLNDKQYAVTVTRGLMETLNDAEIEAVLAHELTHIRNRDVQMMVIAMVIAGVVSFFGEMIFRGMRFSALSGGSSSRSSSSSDGKKGGGGAAIAIIIAIAIAVIAWLLAILIRFSLSRTREYLADAGAVELTKNPDAMISALQKIAGHSEIDRAPGAVMEMCIDNPRHGFTSLFATHPPIDERIKALVRYGGGRELPPSQSIANEQPSGSDPSLPPQEPPRGPWGAKGPWGRRRGPWG